MAALADDPWAAAIEAQLASMNRDVRRIANALGPETTRSIGCRPTVRLIVYLVSIETGVPATEICGPTREAHVCRPRFAVYWLCRILTGQSLPHIGRALGNRDHTTVMDGVTRAQLLRAEDEAFCALTDRIRSFFRIDL